MSPRHGAKLPKGSLAHANLQIMKTHTPGPWRKSNISPHIYGPENEYLAICENPLNARLIAVAPELLAILKDGAFQLERLTGENLSIYSRTFSTIARAAIAKAEGNA